MQSALFEVPNCIVTFGNVGTGEIGSTQSLHRATERILPPYEHHCDQKDGPEPRHWCFASDVVPSHDVALNPIPSSLIPKPYLQPQFLLPAKQSAATGDCKGGQGCSDLPGHALCLHDVREE